MPGFNQKGPMGQGPMTGRGMGRCANTGTDPKDQTSTESDNTKQNLAQNLIGRGLGYAWGRFFGLGRGAGSRGRGMGRQNRSQGNM